MLAITRAPTGQDLVCLVCHKQAQDIDHVVNRGMGGSKARDVPENRVALCRGCHEAKTMGVLETKVESRGDNLWAYFWRRKGADAPWLHVPVEVSQRYKCLVGRLEESDGVDDASLAAHVSDSGADVPGGGLGSGAQATPSDKPAAHSGDDAANDSQPNPVRPGDTSLTHEQRVAIAATIKGTEWHRQFYAGDTALAWRQAIGEEAEQYICDFGYVQETIANIIRVCEAMPNFLRRDELRFSHHVVVYDLNREDMDEWLDKCVEEGWSVKAFREAVKGVKPKPVWCCPDCGHQGTRDEFQRVNQ